FVLGGEAELEQLRRAVALVPRGEWGDRVLAAFSQSWQSAGGSLIAAEHVDQPVQLAQQIADLLQLRQSERPAGAGRGRRSGAVAAGRRSVAPVVP
ncbi:penicillin-binding protein activator, partial [Pseudomonas aeruginosa]